MTTPVPSDTRIRVLELRSVRGTGGGPEKTILLGTARTDKSKFDITVCYIRDQRDGVFAIDAWARSVGVPYVEVAEKNSFDPAVIPALRRFAWSLLRDRMRPYVKRRYRFPSLLAYLMNVQILYSMSRQSHARRQTDVYFNPPLERVGMLQWNRFDEIVTQADDAAIARTIVAMAHTLRLEVVAEGVETEAQLALLRRWRCDAYQGYLCSRPLSAADMTRLLRTRRATREIAVALP